MNSPKALPEAYGIFAILAVLFVVSYFVYQPLCLLWLAFAGFVFYFFRDPERTGPDDQTIAVAPADGQIVAIEERIENEALVQRMTCVTIFLSIFDVHVNRSPIAGQVTHSEEFKGLYLDARNPESSRKNAHRLWIIRGKHATVAVRQITGAIARRIVPWAKVGDELQQGQKFGMIRFGSRTELYVPDGAKILVRVGESVRAGVTPLAELAPPSPQKS